MLVSIISDTHWSARKSSKLFHDYFRLFYENIFFPTLEKYGITTVVHMGDAFDNRKSIDFWGLDWTRKVVMDPLSKYDVHMIVGNHDAFLKNSNKINSPGLLLKEYPNIKVYSEPTQVNIGGLDIVFVPWINQENEQLTTDILTRSNSKVVMGHLELNGFEAHKGHVMEDGRDPKIFNKFEKVFSGHYHTRSDNGTVYYIGNPYEIYFNDLNETRGFVIFDTETLEHFYVDNPYKMHYNLYYDDTPNQLLNTSELENKIVKLVVRKKSKVKDFENFVEKLYRANVAELKIVENYSFIDEEQIERSLESEDTFSLLQGFIDESESPLNKSVLKNILKETYMEASELV